MNEANRRFETNKLQKAKQSETSWHEQSERWHFERATESRVRPKNRETTTSREREIRGPGKCKMYASLNQSNWKLINFWWDFICAVILKFHKDFTSNGTWRYICSHLRELDFPRPTWLISIHFPDLDFYIKNNDSLALSYKSWMTRSSME